MRAEQALNGFDFAGLNRLPNPRYPDGDWRWFKRAITTTSWGCISAYKQSSDLETSLNAHAHLGRRLRRLLPSRCLPAMGISDLWGKEKSYLVLGVSAEHLRIIANDFGQECVLTSEGLVFCDGTPTIPLQSVEVRTVTCRKRLHQVELTELQLEGEQGVTLVGGPPVYAALIARVVQMVQAAAGSGCTDRS
jgi:Protein of unknown function (DUF3293)